MKSKKIVSLLLAGTMTAALLAAPAQAAEAQPIRVSSYKGSTLEVGERSGLIIGPSGTEYTVASSAPDIVAVEQVLTFWVAIAKAEGTAKIITTTPDGQTGGMTISVKSAESSKADETEDTSSDAYSELRLELIRLINEARTANGVSELPVNDALMTAAQTCSDRRYTWHHAPEEGQAAADTGYPYGFGDNLTVFTGTENAAQHALDNWLNSPGHRDTMLDPNCDCIGVGVTQHDGVTYCYMFVGIPNSVNFYA